MWPFSHKSKLSAEEKGAAASAIHDANIKTMEKAKKQIKQNTDAWKREGVTELIFLATGGDRRSHK